MFACLAGHTQEGQNTKTRRLFKQFYSAAVLAYCILALVRQETSISATSQMRMQSIVLGPMMLCMLPRAFHKMKPCCVTFCNCALLALHFETNAQSVRAVDRAS